MPFLCGSVHAGKTSARAVGLIDLYPKRADYCGLESSANKLEGRSLRPLREDPEARWERQALTTYVEVRDERFRDIHYPDGTDEPYDHNADPHEWSDIAGAPEYAVVKRRLAAAIPARFAKSLGDRPG